jgi:hypothetical protein
MTELLLQDRYASPHSLTQSSDGANPLFFHRFYAEAAPLPSKLYQRASKDFDG